MIVMITMTWPITSSPEMAKAAAKNFKENPFPDFMRLTGPFYVVYEDGIRCYALVEIDKGKEEEGFQVFNKRTVNYVPITGYGAKTEVLMTMEEVYPLLSMEVPKR